MIERRSAEVEFRADGKRLVGHASVFDLPSEPIGWGGAREMIAPGAFDYALERVRSGANHVVAIFNHNPDYVIASTRDGSLRLSTDARGLVADMTPIDTQTIRDLVVQPILDGKIRDMSFGFTIAKDGEHEEKRDGVMYRIIDKVERLFDASPVVFGAYPQTDIAARSARIHALRQATNIDSSVIAAIANIDAMVDDLDEYVDTLMDELGIPDPDEAGETEENSIVPAAELRRERRPRFTAVSLAKLNRRLHAARDFELRTLRPRKEP